MRLRDVLEPLVWVALIVGVVGGVLYGWWLW